MFYKRVKYGVKMYKNPILSLAPAQSILIKKRIDFVTEIIEKENHIHYKEMILNSLRVFFLDLSNIIETNLENSSENKPSREEVYFQEFMNLVVIHYKKEHLADFYAKKINISSHYLIQIVKKLSGETVTGFIIHLLYSNARQLLKQPNLTIQQIANELHFSDQSAFGKFFKRKSGVSPLKFRKN
jgi:AraC-like DNA-binding protein